MLAGVTNPNQTMPATSATARNTMNTAPNVEVRPCINKSRPAAMINTGQSRSRRSRPLHGSAFRLPASKTPPNPSRITAPTQLFPW